MLVKVRIHFEENTNVVTRAGVTDDERKFLLFFIAVISFCYFIALITKSRIISDLTPRFRRNPRGIAVTQNNSLVIAMDHCSLVVANTTKALEFYSGILELGLDITRPDLGYPGAWLIVGDKQIHLLELPNPDAIDGRPVHGGRDRHLALQVSDLNRVIIKLQSKEIDFSRSKSGRAALFCRDYDGNAIELVEISVV